MEVPKLKADYVEKIEIQPEDLIPKSNWLKCFKYFLISSLISLMIIAIIAIIVAESFLERTYLAVGVISLVGILLFSIGLIAIIKEHVPSILIFAITMIFYLLLLMYSRIFDTAGWIIVRTIILSVIIMAAIIYCILIRDWRQLQVSRLRQRAIKETQLAQYAATTSAAAAAAGGGIGVGGLRSANPNIYYPYAYNGLGMASGPPPLPPNHPYMPNIHVDQYEQIENPYSLIGGPSTGPTSGSIYKAAPRYH